MNVSLTEGKMQEFDYFNDVPRNFTGKCKIREPESICYYLNGKFHRTDGPAKEDVGIVKIWFLEGKKHRSDGPAMEFADGTKYWYKEGKAHRLDGHAVEYSDGSKFWFVEGERYTRKAFNKLPEVIMYKAGLGVFI